MRACDRCHRRKTRCDKLQPCTPCQKAEIACSYAERARQQAQRAKRLKELDERLQETNSRALLESDCRPSSALNDDDLTLLTPSSSRHSGNQQDTTVNPDEIPNLAINAAGKRQYVGGASGVRVAGLVRASVVGIPAVFEPTYTSLPIGNSPSRPLTQHEVVDAKSNLLPEWLARQLFDAYLMHDHICYPFLLPLFVIEVLERLYLRSTDNLVPFEFFVFHMVIAIATITSSRMDWQSLPSARTHFDLAMTQLSSVLKLGGIRSLQAILLLCQYKGSSCAHDTSASMWDLVGSAGRKAFELGLHREAAYAGIGSIQAQEMKRRCFWSVVAMDRTVSTALGRPFAIHSDAIAVHLPDSVNDDHFYKNVPQFETNSESISRTAVFNHIVSYRLLCGKITSILHGKSDLQGTYAEYLFSSGILKYDLQVWSQNVELLKLPSANQAEADQLGQSSFLSTSWYRILFHNALLSLLRPMPNHSQSMAEVTNLLIHARKSIHQHAHLLSVRRMDYSWVTLQSVFMASLSYIYSLSRIIRDMHRGCVMTETELAECGVSLSDITKDTRASCNVLVAISERWMDARPCFKIIDRLSEAVMEDAIKLQAQRLSHRHNDTGLISICPEPGSDGALNPLPSIPAQAAPTADDSWFSDFPLAVDDEFCNCLNDLQSWSEQNQLDDAIAHQAQEWFGFLGSKDREIGVGSLGTNLSNQ